MRAVAAVVLLASHGAALDFLSIGDWGASGAKTLNPLMGKYSPDFVLAIGDNFYDKGVSGVDDPQFKEKFEDTFTSESLLHVPWFITAGNHDYYGGSTGISAEMEYSTKSSRWVYPSLYFFRDVTGTDGTSVRVISIDTWRINGGDTYVLWDAKQSRGVLRNASMVHDHHAAGVISTTTRDLLFKNFLVRDESIVESDSSGDDAQLQWLETVLSNSTADWNMVIGHFPVHSCTFLEHGDTKSLIKYLQPILEKHNASYFSGHDHILQHIQINGVNYFGSGAGAQKHSEIHKSYTGLKGHMAGKYGFMAHTLNNTAFTTTFIDQDGGHPYAVTLRK